MHDAARGTAYRVLERVERDGAFANLALGNLRGLSERDASFASALVFGVTEKRRALDSLLSRRCSREPERGVRQILRMGVYQIFYMDRVPDSAACDESVKLAKELFGERRAGFVNAVLRSLCREKAEAVRGLAEQPAAVRYSVCDGIADLLRAQYPDDWEDILASFGVRQPLRLRVNPLKGDAEALRAKFDAERDGETLTVRSPALHAQVVREAADGTYLIQGYGSQYAVRLLGAKPGETVFDVCACPGGKALGAAMDMRDRGRVLCSDLHGNKFSLLKKSAETLGLTILETEERDARTFVPSLAGKADRVLCDVPCSGLGTLGAKPELRYKDPSAFAELPETQKRILETSANYVRAGGVLVYSTCTLNRAENGEQVKAFLGTHPSFTLEEEKTFLPNGEACEGFYAARLRKGND